MGGNFEFVQKLIEEIPPDGIFQVDVCLLSSNLVVLPEMSGHFIIELKNGLLITGGGDLKETKVDLDAPVFHHKTVRIGTDKNGPGPLYIEFITYFGMPSVVCNVKIDWIRLVPESEIDQTAERFIQLANEILDRPYGKGCTESYSACKRTA